jgi:hypothetical protein
MNNLVVIDAPQQGRDEGDRASQCRVKWVVRSSLTKPFTAAQ